MPARTDYENNGYSRRRHRSKRDSLSPEFFEDRRCDDTFAVTVPRRRHHSSGVNRDTQKVEDELYRKDKVRMIFEKNEF